MMIISFTYKLVLAAAHWPGLCWQFQKGFPEPHGNLSWHPRSTNVNTVSLLPVCQMFMSSVWMCHVAVFLSKPTGAGHSVALKQFSPSSCIQELMRKETSKNICYGYAALMLYTERRGIKNITSPWYACRLVVWWYYTLLFLWWTITVEPVLKGTCIERSLVYKDYLKFSEQAVYTHKVHTCIFVACAVSKKMWYPIPKTSLQRRGQESASYWMT